MSLNHILAQVVSATVAPLPLLDLQCNEISVNQVIENVASASGATPQSTTSPIAEVKFTGIATTAQGSTAAVVWDYAPLTASSIVRVSLVTQAVAAGSQFAIFSAVPGSGICTVTLISVQTTSTGATGSVTLLFEQIA